MLILHGRSKTRVIVGSMCFNRYSALSAVLRFVRKAVNCVGVAMMEGLRVKTCEPAAVDRDASAKLIAASVR